MHYSVPTAIHDMTLTKAWEGAGTSEQALLRRRWRIRHDQKLNVWIPGLAADWEASHGGELRIHPQQADGSNKKPHVDIAPLHDRFLIFYSDR